jgi:hypothetical protein
LTGAFAFTETFAFRATGRLATAFLAYFLVLPAFTAFLAVFGRALAAGLTVRFVAFFDVFFFDFVALRVGFLAMVTDPLCG